MELSLSSVLASVWPEVSDLVWPEVSDVVSDLVWPEVLASFCPEVSDLVWPEFSDLVWPDVSDLVWPEVSDLGTTIASAAYNTKTTACIITHRTYKNFAYMRTSRKCAWLYYRAYTVCDTDTICKGIGQRQLSSNACHGYYEH